MKWGVLPLAAVLLFGGGAHAQQPEYPSSFFRYLYLFDQSGRVVENGVFKVRVPRFAEIKAAAGIGNYEQFLDYLFAQAPSLKKNYILLHHSQSLQLASPEHPRVVMFDGGVALAISEHPENRVQRVEMMEVDPVLREINMREITFSRSGIKFDDKPTSCTVCHGQPAKPLWDPYDFWPNAFGGHAATIAVKQEKQAYDQLRANVGSSPLLSRLEIEADLTFDNEQINGFTYFVNQIGFTRFWKKSLPRDPELRGYRLPLLAVLNHCVTGNLGTPFETEKSELLQYFPPGSVAPADLARLDEIYADIVASRTFTKNFQDALVPLYFPNPDFTFTIDHSRLESERAPLALLRWLMDLGGLNGANMSLSLLANDYLLSTPTNFMLDLITTLYEARHDMFSGLQLEVQDIGTGRKGWIKLNCEELKSKSLAARRTPAGSQWRSYLALKPERPVVSRCAKCHTEGLNPAAPKIEFYDSITLARRLRNSDLGDKITARILARDATQMPPGQPLSAEESAAMLEFIQTLR